MFAFAQKPQTARQPVFPTRPHPAASPIHKIGVFEHLQRTIGNQAVHRLLQIQTGSGLRVLQTKLVVNTPGDIHEQEADRLSEQIMRMSGPRLQLACSCGGDCPDCRKEQPLQLQPKHTAPTATVETAVPPIVEEVLAAPGRALYTESRDFMESRFGHDFSQVRVHDDSRAAESAVAINALAYTVGRHVVFGAGQYQPGTREGRRLLAHELSHTIQQGAAPRRLSHIPTPAALTAPPNIAMRDHSSHKADDPDQLKGELHPTGKAHLYADQVASIYFGTKSYVPDKDDIAVLTALADEYLYTAQRQGGLKGKVIGHADVETSSDPDNQELSYQRARWTAALFKSFITDKSRLTAPDLQFDIEGAGTSFCLGDPKCKSKESKDALARYRRADIMIFTEKMTLAPRAVSCPPASGAGVKTLAEYIELVKCAETKTGLGSRDMLALLRQMYYGKPWSATAQDPNWNFVIPCSPDLGNPKDKLGDDLYNALHNTVTIEGIDLGHVFVGLESMTCPSSQVVIEKSKFGAGIKLTVDLSNESFATWGGDIGSVAGAFVACWLMTDDERVTKGKNDCHQGPTPESLEQYFIKRQAPPADLEGDIAPFVMRAAEQGPSCTGSLEQKFEINHPISAIFTRHFLNRGLAGMMSHDRYKCFTEAIGATVVDGKITNRAALLDKYGPGVFSFAWAYYVNLKKEIPRSDPTAQLLERNSRAALSLFFDWLQARMKK